MGVSEEIIAIAENEVGSLNPHIHIALTDHINFAIERMKNGMKINNPFTEEIKIIYPEEYRVGVWASQLLKEKINFDIPESEIAFIAMHIHAARQNKKVSKTVNYTFLFLEIRKLVNRELQIELTPGDIGYSRLINHIKFSITRIKKKKVIKNPLLNKIKEEFYDTYLIASKIGIIIEKRLEIIVEEDELGYITLHLQRLKTNQN